ncbi:hypothetical protein [Chiayiivirga flava]|uniref:Uncharacterized protein n=1 Tax=Chiayiivirga flava TaxID=659595 RepID=A0A7W8G0M7_9GAMM|nr:hypothetical protein [Chiayiivirga flava]MBB5209647.1 hypothetical protein [Chiayiivirga flava]
MQTRRASWIVVAMAWACAGEAGADAIRCDSCRQATMRAVAREAGVGTHHVYSLAERKVRSYEVVSFGDITEARAVPTPREISRSVDGLWEILVVSDGTMRMTINVPYETLGLLPPGARDLGSCRNVANACEALLLARLAAGNIPTASMGVNALLDQAQSLVGLREGVRLVWHVSIGEQSLGSYLQELGAEGSDVMQTGNSYLRTEMQ